MKTELEIRSAKKLESFRKRLGEYRRDNGLTLELLAEACEVSTPTISKFIYSGARPRSDSLCNIMVATDIAL